MTVQMRARQGHGRHERGAAAVEFALVVPLLLLLVFGIIDYGRFFFDSVSLRQGAREGARQAVVKLYGGSFAGTVCQDLISGTNVGAAIACSAKAASDITMGIPKVFIPDVAGGWAKGNPLLVCMASQEQGTGFVPLPALGTLKTKTYMSIEVGSPVVTPSYNSDTDPTGLGWGWCS